jgi:hypothetical protein
MAGFLTARQASTGKTSASLEGDAPLLGLARVAEVSSNKT